MSTRNWTLGAVLALALAWGWLPEFTITLLCYIGLYALVAAGLVMLTGVGGMTSFGQAAFVVVHLQDALFDRALGGIAHHGAGDAHRVDAVVVVETTVFGRYEGLFNKGGQRFGGEFFAGGWLDFLDHLAVGREDCDGAWAVETAHPASVGQKGVDAAHQGGLAQGHAAAHPRRNQSDAQQAPAASPRFQRGLACHLS